MALLPVADALVRILSSVRAPLPCEQVAIDQAANRTLAAPLAALRTQPPFSASSMDGYAVRSADTTQIPSRLRLIGESAAGQGFSGRVGPQQCVRIFTGAPLPDGADAVIAQEDTQRDGAFVVFQEMAAPGKFVRRAGLDFSSGDILLATGTRLHARAVGLAAAMGHAHVPVRRRPKCALIATGDELVRPGFQTGPDQIVLSNTYAIAALIHDAGGEAIDCGIVRDDVAELGHAVRSAQAAGADILITTGGASVGERDLVQGVLAREGMDLNFWKIAMRPGKPLLHGVMEGMQILGLPGNPVSSFVCAHIFLIPLIRALLGDPQAGADRSEAAILGTAMPANDMREDYVRAGLSRNGSGALVAVPAAAQDSSMLHLLSQSDALIIRLARAPAASRGDTCQILRL